MRTRASCTTSQFGLADVHGVILDLDGVVYRGDELIPGAVEFFEYLSRTNRRVVALTNHAGATAASYSEKLANLGITLPASNILTSAEATAEYLRQRTDDASVYIVGSEALKRSLLKAGLTTSSKPEYVVVGFTSDLDFAMLTKATKHLLSGATLIGCNPDALLPTPSGYIPECGPTIAYLEVAGRTNAKIVGKPNPWVFNMALRKLGLQPKQCIMIGDTLETDIVGGNSAGIRTVLVLTGNAKQDPDGQASMVMDDLNKLKLALMQED